jgi:hypothetical protein
MSRIVDINDLVDDSSGDDSDDDGGIIGHSVGIGSVIGGVGRSSRSKSSSSGPGKLDPSSSNDGNDGRSMKGTGPNAPGGVSLGQALILSSLVAIIAAASVAIGYAVVGPSPPALSSTSTGYDDDSSGLSRAYMGAEGGGEQKLLEIAERVVVACSEENLDSDMSDCRALCRDRACCFDDDVDRSCADDERWNCAAYAGCANILDGVPIGGEDEDEE